MSLKNVQLGRNGPSVPGMGLGLMSLGGAYGDGGSDEDRLAFLDGVHKIGETFWDDADIYGDSEELVGKWFTANPDKRKDIFLSTKFGFVDPLNDPGNVRSDAEFAKAALERSLKKLKTDYIDLYYCHRVNSQTPIEVTVQAMAEMKA